LTVRKLTLEVQVSVDGLANDANGKSKHQPTKQLVTRRLERSMLTVAAIARFEATRETDTEILARAGNRERQPACTM
jgi:hypothetical protein